MIDLNQAIERVKNTYLKDGQNEDYVEDELIILNDKIIDRPEYWVIPYTSKMWHETENMTYAIVGNAPIIVNKQSGEMTETGSALPIEAYMEDYEKSFLRK